MVPGRLIRASLIVVAGLGLSLLGTRRGDAVPTRDPGAFWPLLGGHQGLVYRDALPRGSTWALTGGQLPAGLTLGSDGVVSGTPQVTGTFSARAQGIDAAGRRTTVRMLVTVRRADESDAPTGAPAFTSAGPFVVDRSDLRLDVVSTFDGAALRTPVRLYLPRNAGGRLPLLLHHRGRGFDWDSYDDLLTRVASHGVAVASVQDQLSFAGGSFSALSSGYDMNRAELGMESASGVMEAVCDALLLRSDDVQDPLFGAFDPENLFWSGHSRGGGATHASHERSFLLRLKGVIYLMAFDLRYFAACKPPGASPAYPIADATPRTPSLIIAAENDGDLVYPIADQLIERASGPATQVTLYGGVHNLISDSSPAEGQARISRASEQTHTADWMVCFIKRWAEGRDDLDRRLYLGAHQASGRYAVTAWWPTARTQVLEDAQDADPARNRLGPNLVNGLRRREAVYYPSVGDLASLPIKHIALSPVAATSVWRLGFDQPLDASRHSRLVLRLAQTDDRGWSGLGVWLRLVDAAGGMAWARVWEPGQGGLLPTWDGVSPHDRFIDVHVPWASFSDATSPGVDRSRLTSVDLVLAVREQAAVEGVIADLVRLE